MGEQPRGTGSAGSVGEEAAKLAQAVQEWLGEWRGGGVGAAGLGGLGAAQDVWAAATAPSHDGAECRMCPICQGMRLLRGSRPEVFEHLADAATSLAAAFRELAGPGDGGGRGSAHPGPPERPSGVERIDLG